MDLPRLFLIWVAAASVATLALFGADKYQARRSGRRISEWHLCLASAAGGWPGGLLGMLLFRHKTAKPSFVLKFSVAFVIWAGGLAWLLART